MHDSANTQRCSINRMVQGEFWAVVSQTGLLRKLYPTTQANSGPQFPDGASWGNCVPLWSARTGWAFRLRSIAESASRNRRSDWDAISRSSPSGKLHPGIRARNGIWFPKQASCGKCNPESPPETGRTFPVEALWETASRLRGQNRDAVSGRGIKDKVAVE